MTVTEYMWDPMSDNVLLESDENGDTTAEYTNEPGQFGQLVSQRRDNAARTYHFDGQHSTRQLTDESQNVTDTATYSAFGEEVARTGATENPFGYMGAFGYYANPETLDTYVRSRTFQLMNARWLSRDPIGFVDGPNLYVFVLNDPVNLSDVTGLYQIELQVDAFIPLSWVWIDPYSDLKGDFRQISRTPLGPGSSRAFSKVVVEMERCVSQSPIVPGSDFSTISDSTMRTFAPGSKHYRYVIKRGTFKASITAQRTGDCSVIVNMTMHATVPWVFAPFAPAIDWAMEFDLHAFEVIGRGVVISGHQDGKHDGFPAYEAYVQQRLVYSHDPIATGRTPFALFPPMEIDVDNAIGFRDTEGRALCCECIGTFDDWSSSRDEWQK